MQKNCDFLDKDWYAERYRLTFIDKIVAQNKKNSRFEGFRELIEIKPFYVNDAEMSEYINAGLATSAKDDPNKFMCYIHKQTDDSIRGILRIPDWSVINKDDFLIKTEKSKYSKTIATILNQL